MKINTKVSTAAWFAIALFGPLSPGFAADSPPLSKDNTRMNRYDQETSSVTADQARNDDSDIQLMQKIRRAVQKEELSAYAQNVKIIAVGGQVILKGTVRTSKEKDIIEREAVRFAGKDNVTNEIMVQGK